MQRLGFEVAAWPFQEARQLLQGRLRGTVPAKGYVLFETGYGPSGLPHIGTFAEVARTTMVRRAFERLAPTIPTRLFCIVRQVGERARRDLRLLREGREGEIALHHANPQG
jgi:lysyl-tRNA synthetase class I